MEILAFVCILITVVFLQIWVFNRFAVSKLDYWCEFSVDEAHEGDEIYLVETVHNRKILPVPWLKADIHTSSWLDFAEASSVVAQENRRVTSSFLLRSYQRTIRRWRLTCLKRGVFNIINVTLVWGDILGSRTSSTPVAVNAGIVVYPEIIDLEEMFIPVNYLQGDTIVKRFVIDDPFIIAGAREYTQRDPMNRIHWPASARESRLMVRKNDFTSQFSITVVLNMQSMQFEYKDVVDKKIVELGIKTAATIFDRALKMGSPVRFATNGFTKEFENQVIFTDEASGKQHVSGLLNILARLELANARDFEDFLENIYENVDHNDVIIITSYLSKGICSMSRKIKLRGNSVKIVLLDKFFNSSELPGDVDVYVARG
jgi:uncharacterized protein (DUF58 family)